MNQSLFIFTSFPGKNFRAIPAMAFLIFHSLCAFAQTIITLDPATRFQTMHGWEAVAWAAQDSATFPQYKEELFRRAINEAGINRLRLEVRSGAENSVDYWTLYQEGQIPYEVWRANRYATVNDNGDAAVLDPAGFHFSELDNTVEKIVLPIRSLVASNGEQLYLNLNYVAFTAQITQGGGYHHANPNEYAEFMLALFKHMDRKYGFVPDAIEIILEPDNVSQWNGNLIGRALLATRDRLQAEAYTPEFIAPSCTSMANAVSYFDALAQVAGAADALAEFSYHRYGGVSDSNLRAIAARGTQRDLRTSMLEWWSDSNGHSVLHADLKVGNNSAWEHGVLGGPGGLDNSMTLYMVESVNPANPIVRINRKAQLARQYYRFVRRGAVRINAQSTSTAFDPLCFINKTGEWVVVVKASTGGGFTLRGLPAGTYGLSYSTPAAFAVKLPDQTISEGSEVSASVPRDGVITILSKVVSLVNPEIRDNSISFAARTLTPMANISIEKSASPADPDSWSTAHNFVSTGLLENWSEEISENEGPLFYRAALQ